MKNIRWQWWFLKSHTHAFIKGSRVGELSICGKADFSVRGNLSVTPKIRTCAKCERILSGKNKSPEKIKAAIRPVIKQKTKPKESIPISVINFLDQVIDSDLSVSTIGSTTVNERDWSQHLGVSRGKLRERLKTLQARGILSCDHGKRSKVLKDIFESEEHW